MVQLDFVIFVMHQTLPTQVIQSQLRVLAFVQQRQETVLDCLCVSGPCACLCLWRVHRCTDVTSTIACFVSIHSYDVFHQTLVCLDPCLCSLIACNLLHLLPFYLYLYLCVSLDQRVGVHRNVVLGLKILPMQDLRCALISTRTISYFLSRLAFSCKWRSRLSGTVDSTALRLMWSTSSTSPTLAFSLFFRATMSFHVFH